MNITLSAARPLAVFCLLLCISASNSFAMFKKKDNPLSDSPPPPYTACANPAPSFGEQSKKNPSHPQKSNSLLLDDNFFESLLDGTLKKKDIHKSILQERKNIEQLEICTSLFSDHTQKALKFFPNVRSLIVISGGTLSKIPQTKNPKLLSRLMFFQCKLDTTENLEVYMNLQELVFFKTSFPEMYNPLQHCESLAQLSQLHYVTKQGINETNPALCKSLEHLIQKNPGIQNLALGERLSAGFLLEIAPTLTMLTDLRFSNCRLHSDELETLVVSRLKTIRLDYNHLTHLDFLKGATRLQTVNLSYNRYINTAGIEVVYQLPSLKILILDNCNLSDNTIEKLLFCETPLKKIQLAGNAFSPFMHVKLIKRFKSGCTF